MAGCRAELLLVLTGTLLVLLGSVRGWERINETQLLNMYKTGHRDKLLRTPLPDVRGEPRGSARTGVTADEVFEGEYDDDAYDTMEDLDFEDEGPYSSLNTFDSVSERDNEVVGNPDLPTWPGSTNPDLPTWPDEFPTWPGSSESAFLVDFEGSRPRSWPGSVSPDSATLGVVCREDGFQITIPEGLMSDVNVLDTKELLQVVKAPASCGYDVDPAKNTLTVPFTGCHVKKNPTDYSLQLFLIDKSGETQISIVSCESSSGPPSKEGVEPRCCGPQAQTTVAPPAKAQNCAVPMAERLPCGYPGMSPADCDSKGCCMDMMMQSCYYPIDECTVDRHFVFAIRSGGTRVPIDPAHLVIPGQPQCKPVIVNNEVAIFKFKVDECGTRAYEVGEMKIYLAEVQTIVKALNLKYGMITRSDPIRFLIECRYSKCATTKQSTASVGYMVKIPTSSLPSSILSNGLYGVQLRIARDHTYSSYFPTYHQPLRLLLGKPVFLELVLKSPKPDAVLLVNYCLAYPRSAKNALVMIFEGCANPNDPNVSVLKVSGDSNNRFQRRFTVNAFQFMEKRTNKYLNEEIYFMCSTEVCRPTEKTCEERCFDGKHY